MRPWGDGDALQAAIDQLRRDRADDGDGARDVSEPIPRRCSARSARARSRSVKPGACARARSAEIAPGWDGRAEALAALQAARRRARERRIASSRATTSSAMTAGLLPNARTARRRRRRRAIAPRSPISASCAPSGRAGSAPSCAPSAAAISCSRPRVEDPERYRVIVEDKPDALPRRSRRGPSRARRSTSTTRAAPIRSTCDFTVTSRCGRAGALAMVAQRTVLDVVPGGAQRGDRYARRRTCMMVGARCCTVRSRAIRN